MRVEELRRALAEEAARQPPVAFDARQALGRHVRRRRLRRVGLLGLPAILALSLGAWALLATHGGGTRVRTAAPSAAGNATVGHTLETSSGSITPHRVVYPATGTAQAEQAKDPDTQFALLDLEICPVGDGADLAPDVFLLRTGDGQLWTPWQKAIAGREPDLAPTLGPQARGCLRGWLTYEVKAGEKITEVLFTPRRAGSAVWRV